jgi:hypothetical protein
MGSPGAGPRRVARARDQAPLQTIYTQVEEDRHTHIQNANQVAPAALARAGVCTTGIVASKF